MEPGFTFSMPSEVRELLERAQQAELWRALLTELGRQALEQVPGSASITFLADEDLVGLLALLELEEVDVQGTKCFLVDANVGVGLLQRFPDTALDELHLCAFDAEGQYMGNQVLDRAELAEALTG